MIDKKIKEVANKLLTDLKNALSGTKIKPKFKNMWLQDCHDLMEICQLILSDELIKAARKIYALDTPVQECLPKTIYKLHYEIRPIKEYNDAK